MGKLIFHLLIWFAVLHAPLPEAQGIVIYGGQSADDLGMYMAEVTYYPYTDTEAELTVIITNLIRPDRGGHITGFALYNPQGRIEYVAPASDFPLTFKVFGNSSQIATAAHDGHVAEEFGAVLTGGLPEWMDLAGGLPPGGSERATTFRFYLSGYGLRMLRDTDFVSASRGIRPMTASGPREGRCFFAVRFADSRSGSERILGRASYLSF